MKCFHHQIEITTRGKGTINVTGEIHQAVAKTGVKQGIVSVLCQHTSCSLVLMENADPSARRDLEAFMDRLVPENQSYFTHTMEGPDDMPSHIKMALTRSSETLPLEGGRLMLGTWQGLFLWEHRDHPHRRRLVVTIMGES